MAFWSTFMLVLVIGTLVYQLGNLFSLYNKNYKMMHHTLRLGVLLCVCYFVTASILLKYCSYALLWEKIFAASVPNYFSTNKTVHRNFLDHVQRSFSCCGFKGPEDYRDAARNLLKTKNVQCFSNKKQKAGILLVPVTCCQGNQCNMETCRDNNKEVYNEIKNITTMWINDAAEACGANETENLFAKRKTFAKLSYSSGCEVPINEATCDFLLRLGILSIALWFCFLMHMQAVRYTRCCLQAKDKARDESSKEGERKKNSETIADFENQKRPIASLRSLVHGLSTLSGVPSLPEVKCEKKTFPPMN
ncbi:Putative tetraspanin family integral membrane pro tein [Trichuris trichiura]|uniref:Putative tetraspanin family integral membrane pro tein n=1 Tax=Trichuris trichiura TaxID=36087 RepID=A0A077YXE9_TRITR|nr:Putative tetraspanin family integral membrane pro tein [Trichuris trichiura]